MRIDIVRNYIFKRTKMKKIILSSILCGALLFGADMPNKNEVAEIIPITNTSELEMAFIQSVMPSTKIEKYRKSMIDGFYEVFFENGQIVYVNPYKEVIFFGEIMNKNGYSFTANNRTKWQEELTNKAMKNTPVDKLLKPAKKVTFNKGSQNDYSFVLFTDPECPYCKTVEKFFSENDTTVHYNFTPLPFHKNAKEWSEIALSSKDFKKTLEDIHAGNVPNTTITDGAKKQLADMEALGKELKVMGTPKIYVIDEKKSEIVQIVDGANIPKLKEFLKK
jgi:thiol:disulfide interchange protein DsbC